MNEDEGRIARKADLDQLDFDMLKSPVVQASDWSVLPAYEWQQAVWWACWQKGSQTAVRTSNESGKTSCVVPVLALSWAAAFPGGLVVVTSASERQFEEQLMPSFDNIISSRKGWRKAGNNIYAPAVDGLPPSKIVCFATKSGDTFEGFHNRVYTDENGNERFGPLLIIVDEAKTIKDDIFTAIERCNPVSELRISTCGEDSGGFYDACQNEDGLWTTGIEWKDEFINFVIPWTDCPHLLSGHTYDRKMAMIEKLGKNHPTVRSILLAEFFRGGTRMVFTDSDIQAMLECMSGKIPHIPGQRRAFCDLSGGGDELTFQMRDGNEVYPIVAWTNDSTVPPSQTADAYIRLFRLNHLKAEDIYADNGGLGAEIIKEIRSKGWDIRRVNNGSGAKDSKSFMTRYAELHWDLKSLCYEMKLILPQDDKLLKQARLRRYTMKNDDSNCITLEKKDAARKRNQEDSPDRLDTLIGLLINIEHLPSRKDWEGGRNISLCGTTKDYIARALAEAEGKEDGGVDFAGGWDGA